MWPVLDPATTSWPGRLEPDVWVQITLAKYPVSAGTDTYEWSSTPLADEESFKEGRLLSYGRVEYDASEPEGNIKITDVQVVVDDADGFLRSRLAAGTTTEHFINRELNIYQLSQAGRRAGLEPNFLFRGWISDVQPMIGRQVQITATDVLGSRVSYLFFDHLIGREIGDEHPNAPLATFGKMYPIVGGELSDRGTLDAQGEPADVGMLGLIDCGERTVAGTGSGPVEPTASALATPAVISAIVDNGGGNFGETTWFLMAAIDENGNYGPLSLMGNVGVTVPGSYTHGIQVFWNQTGNEGAAGYGLWRWTGGPFNFHPFANPQGVPGTQVAYMEHDNVTFDGAGGGADFMVEFTAMPGNPWTGSAVGPLQAPVISTIGTTGVGGGVTYTYRATAVSRFGETNPSVEMIVVDGPDPITTTNSVMLSGTLTNGSSVLEVRIYRNNQFIGFAGVVGNAWEFVDDGTFQSIARQPPTVNTATTASDVWHWMLAFQGAGAGFPDVYGTDAAEDNEPKRVRLTDDRFGPEGECLCPGRPGWPHAEPYIVCAGSDGQPIRQSGVYARGTLWEHHNAGTVTMAVNFCGYEEEGDGSGPVVDGAFHWLKLFLNHFVLLNRGTGYFDGNWWENGHESFDNGDPIIDDLAFDECQAITQDWLGDGVGYKVGLAITEFTSLREVLLRFTQTFGCQIAITRRGQVRPFFIRDDQDPESGPLLRFPIEVSRLNGLRLGNDEVRNKLLVSYAWDADAKRFRSADNKFLDEDSIAATVPGGVVGGTDRRGEASADRLMYYTADMATAFDVAQREIVRRRRRPQYVIPVTDARAMSIMQGDHVRWSHYDRVAEDPNTNYTDPEALSRGIVVGWGIDPMLKEYFVHIRDISDMHPGLTELNQLSIVTETVANAPVVTETTGEAALVLL